MDFRTLARHLVVVALIIGASMLLSTPWAIPAFGGSGSFVRLAVAAFLVLAFGTARTVRNSGLVHTRVLEKRATWADRGFSVSGDPK